MAFMGTFYHKNQYCHPGESRDRVNVRTGNQIPAFAGMTAFVDDSFC
jgi:hypothetical protein